LYNFHEISFYIDTSNSMVALLSYSETSCLSFSLDA
jgi:hypothetical protein